MLEVPPPLLAAAELELAPILEGCEEEEHQQLLLLLYWKWRTNGFEGGIFARASMLNHSCRPNLWVTVANGRISLRSRREIEAGEPR